MFVLIKNKITYIWFILVILTGLTWLLGDNYSSDDPNAYKYVTTALLVLAFFKARLIIMYFMEIANAPLMLRLVFEAWIVLVCLAILGLYFFGGQFFV